MKRNTIMIMCLALVFAAWSAAYAQPPGKGIRGGYEGAGLYPGCPLNLGLSAEQTARLQEQRNAFFRDTTGLRSEIFEKNQELDALMLEPAVDAEKAKKLQGEISELKGQIAEKSVQAQLNARTLLTPDQIKQLPPGCNLACGPGRGCGMGFGGRGRGHGWGRGHGRCAW